MLTIIHGDVEPDYPLAFLEATKSPSWQQWPSIFILLQLAFSCAYWLILVILLLTCGLCLGSVPGTNVQKSRGHLPDSAVT